MSFTTLLTVLFIGLKLTGSIDWSWWLVLMPMWVMAGCWFLAVLAMLISSSR